MSAQVANTILVQVKGIHTDMNSVSFFKEHDESVKILINLNTKLKDFETKIKTDTLSNDGIRDNFEPILLLLLRLYHHSYKNLELNHKPGERMVKLHQLIDELTNYTNHFSMMSIPHVYQVISQIDNLFKSVSLDNKK